MSYDFLKNYSGQRTKEYLAFDKEAKKLARSNLSLDDATERLMKKTGFSASKSKMRIYQYKKRQG